MAENVKKSISSDSASEGNQFRKEESPLYQPEGGGGAGGAAATTNPGNPKGNEASGNEKKARLIRLIIAIVGLVLAVVALIPSILCSLLWWYWIWVLTLPGLILGICGLVLVFLNKKEAPLVCAGMAIIISLLAIIWGSVEVGLANSYQGPSNMKDSIIYGAGQTDCGNPPSDEKLKIEEIQVNNTMLPKDKLEKAFYYHMLGRYCEGRAYDWSFRKAQLQEVMSCKRERDDWFLEKILQKSDSRYKSCKVNHAYEGVDSYSQSPIFQTHQDRIDRTEYRDDKLEEEQQKELEKFCKDFDTKEFIEKREKCDEKIEEKLKPKCKPKKGGLLFTEFDMDWKIFEGFSNSKRKEEKEKKKLTFKYQLEEKFAKCGKSVRTCHAEVPDGAGGKKDEKKELFRVYHFSKYNFKYLKDEPEILEKQEMLDKATKAFGYISEERPFDVFEKIKFLDKVTEKVDGFEVEGDIECTKKYKRDPPKDKKEKAKLLCEGKVREADKMIKAVEDSTKTKTSGPAKDYLDGPTGKTFWETQKTELSTKLDNIKKNALCCYETSPGSCSGCESGCA